MVWEIATVAVPSATLLVSLPVIIFGRDVHRLLAIGLCVFPTYLLFIGFMRLLSNTSP